MVYNFQAIFLHFLRILSQAGTGQALLERFSTQGVLGN